MLESLQLPILVVALLVMSWAVVRLISHSKQVRSINLPPEVQRWQADLTQLSQELQAELDEKMAAVSALSQAYEQASRRLSNLIQEAEKLENELEQDNEHDSEEQVRLSA